MLAGRSFTASSKGLVCSKLALPFNVDGASTVVWEWSTAAPVNFSIIFSPRPGSGARFTLGEHMGTAWAKRGVPVVMAQPLVGEPERKSEALVLRRVLAASDAGSAEVEGAGEISISWACEEAEPTMLSGFFGVSDPDTELKYACHLGSTSHLRAEEEARHAKLAAAARVRQAKMAELLAKAEASGAAARAASADAAQHGERVKQAAPLLEEVEAAFAEQQASRRVTATALAARPLAALAPFRLRRPDFTHRHSLLAERSSRSAQLRPRAIRRGKRTRAPPPPARLSRPRASAAPARALTAARVFRRAWRRNLQSWS